ncbi:MAG: hypothetical protein HC938_14085 [Nitrospira sp.]|nr:hypothetical protein [Nitrospira sp.]
MGQAEQQAWGQQVLVALGGQGRRLLIEFLQRQRWFGGKGKPLTDVRVVDAFDLSLGDGRCLMAIASVEYRGGAKEEYAMLLTIRPRMGAGR